MNLLSDDDSEPHLTQQDYELFLGSGQLFDDEHINNFDEPTSQYKFHIDSILAELQDKYDLRPRDKTVVVDQPKKVLFLNKGNEVVVSKPFTETSTVQTKQVEAKATQTKT
jgi:ribosomal protein L21